MTNNANLKAYSFSYTVDGETTSDWIMAEDMIDAALQAMEGFRMEGLKIEVFNMREVSWQMSDLFGHSHIRVPGLPLTLCSAKLNPNLESEKISNFAEKISCHECCEAAKGLMLTA